MKAFSRLIVLCGLAALLGYVAWLDAEELVAPADPEKGLRTPIPLEGTEKAGLSGSSWELVEHIVKNPPQLLQVAVVSRDDTPVGPLQELKRPVENFAATFQQVREFTDAYQWPAKNPRSEFGETVFTKAVAARRAEEALRAALKDKWINQEQVENAIKDYDEKLEALAEFDSSLSSVRQDVLHKVAAACLDWHKLPDDIKQDSSKPILGVLNLELNKIRVAASSKDQGERDASVSGNNTCTKFQLHA